MRIFPRTPRTHDYRRSVRCWGHDLSYEPTTNDGLKAMGWGRGINPGDWVLLSNGEGETRYRFDEIRYFGDPGDMWKARLSFAPRS